MFDYLAEPAFLVAAGAALSGLGAACHGLAALVTACWPKSRR